MSITAVLTPLMKDQDFIKQFGSDTRFCLIPDVYNTSPTGWPNQMSFVRFNPKPLAEQLMIEYPNVTFITHNWRQEFESFDNVYYYPTSFLYHHLLLKHRKIETHKNKDLVCANAIGGAKRVNRILASHWLAKNFLLEELVWAFKGNNSLEEIQHIIRASPHYQKKHIQVNKFLEDNFPPVSKVGNIYQTFVNHFIPNLFNKSLCSIVLDCQTIEIMHHVSEKTLFAFASDCLVLFVGSYQIIPTLEWMGFNTFDNIFDLSHLESTDRYAMTISGLENNRHILSNKELLVEYYHKFRKELQHNQEIACSSDHLFDLFAPTTKLWKEGLKYVDNMDAIKKCIANEESYNLDSFYA